jgi:hypothetical protein
MRRYERIAKYLDNCGVSLDTIHNYAEVLKGHPQGYQETIQESVRLIRVNLKKITEELIDFT